MGIRSQSTDSKFPGRTYTVEYRTGAVTANFTGKLAGVAKADGRIVDVICTQQVAGDGTHFEFDVKKNGSTVLGTLGKCVAATGANKSVDSSLVALITLPSNFVRPVLSTTNTTIEVSKGDVITVEGTKSGTYNTGGEFVVTVVIGDRTVPKQG